MLLLLRLRINIYHRKTLTAESISLDSSSSQLFYNRINFLNKLKQRVHQDEDLMVQINRQNIQKYFNISILLCC